MELKIYSFKINENDIKASGETRSFTITGDPGAVFSLEITNEDSPSKYYDFSTRSFTTTKSRLKHIHIPSSGTYTNAIVFPSVTDNDHYNLDLWAENHFNTKHLYSIEKHPSLDGTYISKGTPTSLLRETLYQYVNTVVTFKPDSKTIDSNYKAMPTDVTISAPRYSNKDQNYTADIEWVVESNPSSTDTFALFIVRQPLETDFEARVTTTVDGATTSSKTIVLDSVDNLHTNMYVTGTGVTSTPPRIHTIDTITKTITVSSNQSLTDERTLYFWSEGNVGISKFDADVKFSDLKIVLDPLTVTVNGATTSSRNITLDDAGGIRVGTDATIRGVGFDNSTTQRPTAINYSTKVLQVTSNQSLEDNTILEIDGYGKKATITGTITMTRVPDSNLIVYFDVEAVVTALTS